MKAIPVAFGLLAAVAATAGQAADKVYKWKDANGIVHFSDAPPPKGTEFNNVKIVNQSAAITTQEPAAKPAEGETPAADPNNPDAPPQPSNDSREARCAQAQEKVSMLSSEQAVNIQRDGKLVALEGKDRKAELDIARASVAALCGENPT
jgi:hypothetical protein